MFIGVCMTTIILFQNINNNNNNKFLFNALNWRLNAFYIT